MRVGLFVILAIAACFDKPPRPVATPDAPCVLGDWTGPTMIPLQPFDFSSDAATSPWMNDTRDDLWFTRLAGGDSAMSTIMHVQNGTPMLVDLGVPVGDDNPFLSDDGLHLYFDRTQSSTRMIYEGIRGDRSSAFTVGPYSQLGMAEEPALSPDNTVLYYSPDAANLFVTTRKTPSDAFTAGVTMPGGDNDPIESPSVSSNLQTIYFSHHGVTDGERIYQGSIAPDGKTLFDVGPVGSFQIADMTVNYFDPNISRDGKTLVFASNYQHTPHAQLYYVSRDCM